MTDISRADIKARKKARSLAVQALYQWQFGHHNLADVEMQFLTHELGQKIDRDYFLELLHQIPASLDELDALLQSVSDRPLAELTEVELSVLRIAVYELKNRPDVPYRVIINEALDLSKKFGSNDGHKFVNGILDQLARKLRENEV